MNGGIFSGFPSPLRFLRTYPVWNLLLLSFFFAGSAGCKAPENPGEKPPEVLPAKDSTPSIAKKRIVFFGNSITAGYGLRPEEAFPALLQARIDSLNLSYQVVNAAISGETSADGKSRIGWVMQQPADIFFLELGGNDGLRGIPVTETRNNLQAIIDSVRKRAPGCKIMMAGMQIPPNLGPVFTNGFREVFGELSKKNHLFLIPFLLEGVGGDPALNQPDGIHPTAEGDRMVAETVWKYLQPLL